MRQLQHHHHGRLLDKLNNAIKSLELCQTRIEVSLVSDLASAKNLYWNGKRKEAIAAMRRSYKNKTIQEHVMGARFQLIALRIESQLTETLGKEINHHHHHDVGPSTGALEAQQEKMQSVIRKLVASMDVSTLPSDLTLLRRLARISQIKTQKDKY